MASRIFVPLTGAEVSAMVLKKIEQVMENDQAFRQHLTYPTIQWRWTLEMNCAPSEPSEIRVQAHGAIINPGEPPAVMGCDIVEPPKEPSSCMISDEQDVRAGHPMAGPNAKAPDEVREEHEMPTMGPEMLKVGGAAMIFDAVRQAKSRGGRAAREAAEAAK